MVEFNELLEGKTERVGLCTSFTFGRGVGFGGGISSVGSLVSPFPSGIIPSLKSRPSNLPPSNPLGFVNDGILLRLFEGEFAGDFFLNPRLPITFLVVGSVQMIEFVEMFESASPSTAIVLSLEESSSSLLLSCLVPGTRGVGLV